MIACAVCFSGADSVAAGSLNAGIAVLMAVTVVVLLCFARFFLTLARRSRDAAHLVGWGPDAVIEAPPSTTIDDLLRGGDPVQRGTAS